MKLPRSGNILLRHIFVNTVAQKVSCEIFHGQMFVSVCGQAVNPAGAEDKKKKSLCAFRLR